MLNWANYNKNGGQLARTRSCAEKKPWPWLVVLASSKTLERLWARAAKTTRKRARRFVSEAEHASRAARQRARSESRVRRLGQRSGSLRAQALQHSAAEPHRAKMDNRCNCANCRRARRAQASPVDTSFDGWVVLRDLVDELLNGDAPGEALAALRRMVDDYAFDEAGEALVRAPGAVEALLNHVTDAAHRETAVSLSLIHI